MKLISVFATFLMAVGAKARSVEVGRRELQQSDRFQVEEIKLTADATGVFKFEAGHNEADTTGSPFSASTTWAGTKYIYLFSKCPGGQAVVIKNGGSGAMAGTTMSGTYITDLSGADGVWLNVQGTGSTTMDNVKTTWDSGDAFDTEFSFKIDSDVDAVTPSIWTPEVGSTTGSGTAKFCIWFGVGDGSDPYGFREIEVEAKFDFDDGFNMVEYKTYAYKVETGESTTKNYRPRATTCNPGSPIYPGEPVCLKVYPEIRYDTVSATGTVTEGTWTLAAKEEARITTIKTANLNGPKSGSNPAQNSYSAFDLTQGSQKCGDGSATATDDQGNTVSEHHCHLLRLLPITYFVTYDSSSTTWEVTGTATIVDVPTTRRLGEGVSPRRLDMVTEEISDEVELTLVPSEDSSASKLTAAAAGFLAGAALLI